MFGIPTPYAIGAGVIAGGLAIGYVYFAGVGVGERNVQAKWDAAQATELRRQIEATTRATTAETGLAVVRAERDKLLDERQARDEADMAKAAADAAAGPSPPCRCVDSSGDVKRLYDILR